MLSTRQIQAMLDQAEAKHATSVHAIPNDPVTQEAVMVAHVAGALSVTRREHYEKAVRDIEARWADGQLKQDEAVEELRRLGMQAHRERS